MIYLDNQIATKPCSMAVEKLSLCDTLYAESLLEPQDSLQKAKDIIFEFLGLESEHCLFSSSYSEVLQAVYDHIFLTEMRSSGKNHIMVLPKENKVIRAGVKRLEEFGAVITDIPVKENGQIDLVAFEKAISPKCCFISLSWANDLTGVVYPIEEIKKICRKKKVLLHLDISAGFGKLFFDKADIDYLTLHAKTIHGGSSSGLCISLEKIERRVSFDISSIYGFAFAIQQACLFLDQMGLEVVRKRNLFENILVEKVGAKVLFIKEARLPNVSCLAFNKVHQEALHYELNEKKIFATLGKGDRHKIDEILKTAGIDEHLSYCGISFALSRFTTEEEIINVAEIIGDVVSNLKKLTEDLV